MLKQKIAIPKSSNNCHGKIIGTDKYQYSIDTHWGKLDEQQIAVENCHAFAIDSLGRIFMVTDHPDNNIVVYDKEGNLIDVWGREYPGAHGIKIVSEQGQDYIYLVDSGWILNRNWDGVSTDEWDSPTNKVIAQSGFVAKLTIDGKLIYTIGHPQTVGAYQPDMPFRPTDVAIAANGDIYITDGYGSDYVLRYNSKGQYQEKWGGHDNQDPDHNLINAHGIELDNRDKANPKLIVSSRAEQCLKQFTLAGEYLATIATPGAWIHAPVIVGSLMYSAVCWSHIDGSNVDGSGFICIFDTDNQVIATLGGEPPSYIDGKLQPLVTDWSVFTHCHGLCVDDEGNIYVGQWRANGSYPMKLTPV
ncbi:6-bladed beta-propeller [Psychrosphaera sp. 1_MG-2023]|uniref:6-bladed beta-propeller n=1 Tax=Psychrosphaera sp. 1_MG-2023 TaxID=3062643 RepID=UPI0026E18AB7|nr:6-bladed beta-propeller [Psychrosphaera sp. 1_MG-2023]MDO6719378.1 6-bladed beta-propeller [Psychrosphaera sp. 1_MG-2023]